MGFETERGRTPTARGGRCVPHRHRVANGVRPPTAHLPAGLRGGWRWHQGHVHVRRAAVWRPRAGRTSRDQDGQAKARRRHSWASRDPRRQDGVLGRGRRRKGPLPPAGTHRPRRVEARVWIDRSLPTSQACTNGRSGDATSSAGVLTEGDLRRAAGPGDHEGPRPNHHHRRRGDSAGARGQRSDTGRSIDHC
jgi:hypothetical protein